MKFRNFTKFSAGIALISALPVGMVISNPHTHTHSSLVVESKTTNDISWSIDGNGNIRPTDKSQIQGEITIPNTVGAKVVTGIASFAFQNCTSLTSVTFAEGSKLNSIGKNALWNCSSLTSINIPSSVASIGRAAFYKCSALASINIPSGVTSIGEGTFDSCSALTSINIPSGVTIIAGYAFQNCSSLTSVTIPSSVTTINDGVFNECKSLKTIDIPSGVTSIGIAAFRECSSLKSVNFAEGSKLNSIGKYAFSECASLTSVNIPSSVTSIKRAAFQNCSSLTDVTFNWDNGQLGTDKLTLETDLFNNTSRQTINFHIPLGTKDQYNAKFTQDILGTNITAKWIEDNPPVPSSNSNLALILGLTFGFIILIGIGSYLGYRYYKHRKTVKNK